MITNYTIESLVIQTRLVCELTRRMFGLDYGEKWYRRMLAIVTSGYGAWGRSCAWDRRRKSCS